MADELDTNRPSGQIINALRVKANRLGPCPLCLKNDGYTVEDQIVHFPMTEVGTLTVFNRPGKYLPCAAATCSNCGYTLFINLFRLGLPDLTGLKGPDDADSKD